MSKKEDIDTRYYIDLDLRTRAVINWDYGQRHELAQELEEPAHHRMFLSKGQYGKLVEELEQI